MTPEIHCSSGRRWLTSPQKLGIGYVQSHRLQGKDVVTCHTDDLVQNERGHHNQGRLPSTARRYATNCTFHFFQYHVNLTTEISPVFFSQQ